MGRPYWKCIDCGTEISEVGRELRVASDMNEQFEYCFRCVNWNPQVVIGYR